MVLDQNNPNFSFRDHGGFKETSPASKNYNCIAWAAGDSNSFWWPDNNFYCFWPRGVPRKSTLDAFIAAFETLGYSPCDSEVLENEFEKVAIFESNNGPTHASRQLISGPHRGLWTSKMGKDIDIAHSLKGVSGKIYGTVAAILRRKV